MLLGLLGGNGTWGPRGFWRWPEEHQRDLRDDLAPRFIGDPPAYTKLQRHIRDEQMKAKMAEKLNKFRRRGCIRPGVVTSLLNTFAMRKGDHDLRPVFDATKSGLNLQLHAPWFSMPMLQDFLRALLPGYFCGDNDIGE